MLSPGLEYYVIFGQVLNTKQRKLGRVFIIQLQHRDFPSSKFPFLTLLCSFWFSLFQVSISKILNSPLSLLALAIKEKLLHSSILPH